MGTSKPCPDEFANPSGAEKGKCDLLKLHLEMLVHRGRSSWIEAILEKVDNLFKVIVVHQPIRGYGAAYLAGTAAAQGWNWHDGRNCPRRERLNFFFKFFLILNRDVC